MKAEMLLPKLTLSLPFTFLLFVHRSFRNFAYLGTCLITSRSGMFTATFLNISKISFSLSPSSILLFFRTLCGKRTGGTYSFSLFFFSSDHNRRRRRKLSWRRFRWRKFRSYLNEFFILFRGCFCNFSGSQRNSAHISITIRIDNSLCWKLVRTLSLHIIYLSSKLSHLCGQGLNARFGSLLKLKVVHGHLLNKIFQGWSGSSSRRGVMWLGNGTVSCCCEGC